MEPRRQYDRSSWRTSGECSGDNRVCARNGLQFSAGVRTLIPLRVGVSRGRGPHTVRDRLGAAKGPQASAGPACVQKPLLQAAEGLLAH